MYKLLTEEEKIKIDSEYKYRRYVIILLFFAILLLIGAIGLVPSYVTAISREKEANFNIATLNQSLAGKTTEGLDSLIKSINTKIKLFSPALETDKPYEAFKDIISIKPSGVKISKLGYVKDKTTIEYTLEGIAIDRRALVEFQTNLNNSNKFTSTDIPVSDLAKDKNISFNLTLKPKK